MVFPLGELAGALFGALAGGSAVAWGCRTRLRAAAEADEPDWPVVEERAEPVDGKLTWIYEVDPARMPPGDLNHPSSFYFPNDFTPTRPPVALVDWWAWAHRAGGHDVRLTKILVTLQALEEVSLTIGDPTLDHDASDGSHGVVCCPEIVGGGRSRLRTFEVDLDAAGGPVITYADRQHRSRSFVLDKGQTEQIEVIAYADNGLHEWTMRLPVTVDGSPQELPLDLYGGPFVTVGGSAGCRQLMWSGGDWT